jgi:hypothetical protein
MNRPTIDTVRGQRRVVCAAVKYASGYVIAGARHFDLVMHEHLEQLRSHPAYDLGVRCEQGFIDQRGVFMNRREAWQVALAANQILFRCGGDDTDGGTLYSENLY